jgi:hypothetical protein
LSCFSLELVELSLKLLDYLVQTLVLFNLLEVGINGRDGKSSSLAEAIEEVVLEWDTVDLVSSLVVVIVVVTSEVQVVAVFLFHLLEEDYLLALTMNNSLVDQWLHVACRRINYIDAVLTYNEYYWEVLRVEARERSQAVLRGIALIWVVNSMDNLAVLSDQECKIEHTDQHKVIGQIGD